MTNTAVVLEPTSPLADLVDAHFREDALDSLLDLGGVRVPKRAWDAALGDLLRDFLSRPGKEFRARLVEISWTLGGGKGLVPRDLSLLVELLHAGSLIIDDIEDESTYRRGKPALHRAYGVPRALNAGNLLYFLPLSLLRRMTLSEGIELELHRRFNDTLVRCHHGQALDVGCRVSELSQHEVLATVEASTRLKTGSLTELATTVGAVAARAPWEVECALSAFGRELGVALQMLDDWGGIMSQKRLHKGHEDLVLERLTWPWAWLATSLDALEYTRLARLGHDVAHSGVHPEVLAEEMRARIGDHGKRAARARLDRALHTLSAALGHIQALGELESEIDRLEASYE